MQPCKSLWTFQLSNILLSYRLGLIILQENLKALKILTLDVGGTNIKAKIQGPEERRKFPSGAHITPDVMVEGVQEMVSDWEFDVISIGFPGIIKQGQIINEPANLGNGWVGFDLAKAFGKPVKLMNDAAMQALGSYQGSGVLLFLGLGTGLGSAVVVDGTVLPMELAHLSYRSGTFEDYVGFRGMEKYGKEEWQQHVFAVVERFKAAFLPDDIVLGGGKSKYLTEVPQGCRLGTNKLAYEGGFKLWP